MARYETARGRVERMHEREEIVTAEDWAAVAREDAEDAAAARAYAGTLEGQRDAAYRTAKAMDAAAIDSGVYTDEQRASAWAEYRRLDDAIRAESETRFAAEWTREVTVERRAAWNGWVREQARRTPKGIDGRVVAEQERRQGWVMESLKRAVALHNLVKETLQA